MQVYLSRIKFLVLSLVLVLFCYLDCRILFYLFNTNSFPGVGFSDFLEVLFWGVQFDVSAILYVNALFIVLVLFPIDLWKYSFYRLFAKIIFLLGNGISILANCADFAYFDFVHKRTTFDVFTLMTGQADMGELLPLFIKDFWYVFVITTVFVLLINSIYNRLLKKFVVINEEGSTRLKVVLFKTLLFVFFAGLTVLGMRGGFQLIPIGMVNAGDHVSADKIPLVLNTPFSIMKSAELSSLEEKHYFTDADCAQLVNPCKKTSDSIGFKPYNVVVIILESFSKEYTGLSGKESYTPFLDSLMKESYTFSNAFSNGKRSIEGIPAVLSSTPSMREAYLNTIYSGNKINSLPNLLKQKGYTSSFFHGGNNGTMSFDSYCSLAGFDRYFGRNEYSNNNDYDGSWGIWDEPFFQRYAIEIGKMKQPFFSAIFSLSSHHPFAVPEKYKNKFKEGPLPINKCIGYTDYSLQKFFETAKKQAWFKNTLFVITADHTGPSENPFYSCHAGNFQIPILFYQQGTNLRGIDSSVVQQIDIMNGVLSYLHFDQEYFSFGNNLFDSTDNRFAIGFNNEQYQFFWRGYELLYNEQTDSEVCFKIKYPNVEQLNYIDDVPEGKTAKAKLKAFIQTYNNRLIQNKMTCEKAGH